MPDLKIVRDKPTDPGSVYFSAWVKLEDDDGNEIIYRIVGPDEFDVKRNFISMDSPVARALMKKSIDDEVVVKLPGGDKTFCIIDIAYELMT